MTERETSVRSVIFLVIGILLLLSLVVCIYIVSSESDLVKTKADVVEVKKDVDGTGKNRVSVAYDVDGETFRYNFLYKGEVNVDDTLDIYYHQKNNTSVTTSKTSKIIFICPLMGLVLCVFGLIELFSEKKNETVDFKTTAIGIVGNTQQLSIVSNAEENNEEEQIFSPNLNVVIPSKVEEITLPTNVQKDVVENVVSPNVPVQEEPKKITPTIINFSNDNVAEQQPDLPTVKEDNIVKTVVTPKATVSNNASTSSVLLDGLKRISMEEKKQEKDELDNDELFEKIKKETELKKAKEAEKQENINEDTSLPVDNVISNEDNIKKVLKDVIKEVMAENKETEVKVKEESEDIDNVEKENNAEAAEEKNEKEKEVETKEENKETEVKTKEEFKKIDKEEKDNTSEIVEDKKVEENDKVVEVETKEEIKTTEEIKIVEEDKDSKKEENVEIPKNVSEIYLDKKEESAEETSVVKAEESVQEEDEKSEEKDASVVKDTEKVSEEISETSNEIVSPIIEEDETPKLNINDYELPKEEVVEKVEEIKKDENSEETKKVENKVISKILPNYYYISESALIYQEAGKSTKEMPLKTVKQIVRTVNSKGEVVKILVATDEIKCILTKMKNIDLEHIANLLRNKMVSINDKFVEEIENKEY